MSLFQKSKVSVFAVLCLAGAVALCACSPEAEEPIPTERLEIRGIPIEVRNTKAGAPDASKPTFKVYAQLSSGTTVAADAVAEGTAFLSDGVVSGSTFTVIIPLHVRFEKDVPYKGIDWSTFAILLSPDDPENIFEMNVKGNIGGPSPDSSTVVFNWSSMRSLKLTTIESYMALFGYRNDKPGYGLILDDPNLVINPNREPPDDTAARLYPSDPTKFSWDDFSETF